MKIAVNHKGGLRMEPDKIKHLEFIQNIITRMNTNSLQLKGWTVAIVSALLALYANSSNLVFIIVAIIPVLLFWFIDTFYLQKERKFRGVYDDVAGLTSTNDRIEVRLFEMPIDEYTGGKYCYWNVFFSTTLSAFYGIILALVIICILIIKYYS